MNNITMINSLRDRIQESTKDFLLDSNVEGVQKAPEVMSGYLKAKKRKSDQTPPEYPFVLVRFHSDEDNQNGYTSLVHIIAGTYSEDEQNGWRDPLNILSFIKRDLLNNPIFGGSFSVSQDAPQKIELPEDQPFPEWVGILKIYVHLPQIEGEWLDGEI